LPAVWRHRFVVRPESALRGRTSSAIIEALLAEVDVEDSAA
jgi:hypothetical protein